MYVCSFSSFFCCAFIVRRPAAPAHAALVSSFAYPSVCLEENVTKRRRDVAAGRLRMRETMMVRHDLQRSALRTCGCAHEDAGSCDGDLVVLMRMQLRLGLLRAVGFACWVADFSRDQCESSCVWASGDCVGAGVESVLSRKIFMRRVGWNDAVEAVFVAVKICYFHRKGVALNHRNKYKVVLQERERKSRYLWFDFRAVFHEGTTLYFS